MATLNIQAPDGKTLNINIPEGTDPSKYDSIVEEVMKDYSSNSAPQDPGILKSAAAGIMSGVPGGETLASGVGSAFSNKSYEDVHKNLEDLKNQAWEQHPVAYGAGKVGGMVGTGVLAPEVEGLGGAAALGSAFGAGAGLDTAEKPSQMPVEALKGAGTGAVLGSALHGVGALINKIPGATKGVLASLGSKTNAGDIESYLKNPEAINNALSKEAISSKLAETTGDIGKASSFLSGEARSALNPENSPLNIDSLKSVVDDASQKYLTSGVPATAADQTSLNALNNQYEMLANIAGKNNGNVPEDTLRAMIDRIQAATKDSTYGNPEAGASQSALKELGGRLNEVLRKANPNYAESMAPSAEAAGLQSDLASKFGIENGKPTDSTYTRVGQVGKPGKTEGADLLAKVKDMTGQDFQDLINNSNVKANFDAPDAGGALKTLFAGLGFGVGKTTGVPFGGITGAAIGRYGSESVDGGNIAKGIMDMYLKHTTGAVPEAISGALQKFGPMLINAAKVGGNQLAATHFILATSNPEYQDLIQHSQENMGQ